MSEETKKDYVVLADGQTVFDFNERGDMTHKARYSKGDTVALTDAQAAGLLRHGTIRDAGEATDDAEPEDTATEPSDFVGGSGEKFSSADLPFDAEGMTDAEGNPVESVEGVADPVDSEENLARREEQEEEDFDSMDYADLQALAKTRTGNGGGSKADLIERLRAHKS